MIQIIFFSFVIMLASLAGAIVVWKKAGMTIERKMHFLVSFSAGVFLVVAFQLGKETIIHASGVSVGLFWILAGAVIVWTAFKFLPFFHHHHDNEGEKEGSHSRLEAGRILSSDAIHNVGDGVLLTASFAVSPAFGIATALSIFIHELVQEVSEFFVLRQAGYSVKKALVANFLVSSTILIGAVGSFFLIEAFEILEVPLLGIAAGSFLVVVAHDLIPHTVKDPTFKIHYLKHIAWFVAGLLIMFSINSFLVHSHGHDEEDDHHHDEHSTSLVEIF